MPHTLPSRLSPIAVVVCAAFATLPAEAQVEQGTGAEIVFAVDLEERGRAQLRRILATYDLDPWIVTNAVKIEAGAEPHSMPVLTLNTDFLDDDDMQLSIFVHEQAHWIVDRARGREAALERLRALYPHPPRSDVRTYQHLLVAWIELDALVELLGEEKARRTLEGKVRRVAEGLAPDVAGVYTWYNERVLQDTAEIGAIAAAHGMLVTPGSGLQPRMLPE